MFVTIYQLTPLSSYRLGPNRDSSLPYVVIVYDSLVTPPSHIAVPLDNPTDLDARRVLKEKYVPGYNKEDYACERTTVRSRDGTTDIPVSLVFRRDVLTEKNKGPVPTHMLGYGSYGASIEGEFIFHFLGLQLACKQSTLTLTTPLGV